MPVAGTIAPTRPFGRAKRMLAIQLPSFGEGRYEVLSEMQESHACRRVALHPVRF